MGRKDDYIKSLLNAWGDELDSVPQPKTDSKLAARIVKEAAAARTKAPSRKELKKMAKDSTKRR